MIVFALCFYRYDSLSAFHGAKGSLLISPPSNKNDFSASFNPNNYLGLIIEKDLNTGQKLVIKEPYFDASYTTGDPSLVAVVFDDQLNQYKVCRFTKNHDKYQEVENLYICRSHQIINSPVFVPESQNLFYMEENNQSLYVYNIAEKSSRLIATNIANYGRCNNNIIYSKYTDKNEPTVLLYDLTGKTETIYRKNATYLGSSLDGRFISFSGENTRNIIEIVNTQTNAATKIAGMEHEFFFLSTISPDGDLIFTASRTEDNPSQYKLSLFNIKSQKRKDIFTEYNGMLLPVHAYWK